MCSSDLRARSASYVSIGAGAESRDYRASPDSLMDRIDSLYRHRFVFPRVSLSFGWSNTQFPALAISPEDGLAFAVTTRLRKRLDSPALSVPAPDTADRKTQAFSAVATMSLYKSIPLPGFAHHVFALRGAGGYIDSRNPDCREIGRASCRERV